MKLAKKIKRYFLCKNPLTRNLYIGYIRNVCVKLKPDEAGVISVYNLGETYLFCAMLESFKRKYNISKVVWISDKKYHQDICELFQDRMIRCCTCRGLQDRVFRDFRKVKAGALYYMHEHADWNLEMFDRGGINFIQHLKRTAGLDPDAVIEHHKTKEIDRVRAKELFSSLGLRQNKTVLVSPEAKSCLGLETAYCQNLCVRLQKKGYDVFLNSVSPDNRISSVKSVFFPLSMAVPFCDLCGYVIAVRSGFCEVVSGSRAGFHILYPDRLFRKVFPVKEFMVSDNIREYILNEIPQEEVLDKIVNAIDGDNVIRSGRTCTNQDAWIRG